MGSFSDFLEDELLDHVLMKGAYTPPTNIFVALCTADPTDAGTGSTITEPASNYARVSTSGSDWDAAASGATANATAIEFTQATGSWGTITHFALVDAASAGNMLGHGALDTSKAIESGDTAKFAIGELDITLD